jgi:hypothetical protein
MRWLVTGICPGVFALLIMPSAIVADATDERQSGDPSLSGPTGDRLVGAVRSKTGK